MKLKGLLSQEITKKAVIAGVLLIVALLSIFIFSKPATSKETYASTIQSIDDKKATVMGLTASAATTSTILASIPGDATTPIANQIMEISAYLLVVVCVLVLEKSLLTVMGYLSFNILIPVACVLLGIYTFFRKEKVKALAIKCIVFALVIVTIIPFSLKISDLIYDVNKSTIEQVTSDIDKGVEQEQPEEEKSWLDKIIDKVKDGVSAAEEYAKQVLNSFIDAIALFIITYCAIPIIVVLIVIWFIKFLFGIAVPVPKVKNLPIFKRKESGEKSTDLQEV